MRWKANDGDLTVFPYNGNTWTKQCSGEVQARPEEYPAQHCVNALMELPRRAFSERWYDIM